MTYRVCKAHIRWAAIKTEVVGKSYIFGSHGFIRDLSSVERIPCQKPGCHRASDTEVWL